MKTTPDYRQTFRLQLYRAMRLFMIVAMVIATALVHGQKKKEELQKEKEELNRRIELNKKLLEESEQQQKSTLGQVKMLTEQIKLREQLLAGIGKQLNSLEAEIRSKEKEMNQLEKELKALKDEYARMVVQAYKNKSSYNNLLYLFSSKDFNQAYKRLKMMQRYADIRQRQAGQIEATKADLQITIQLLEASRNEKRQLAAEQRSEKDRINKDKKSQQEKLTALQAEEKRLRERLRKQESDRRDLEAKIKKIIEEELKKTVKTNSSSAGSASASSKRTLDLAPETKLANSNFENNKGELPWPVSAGILSDRFGKHEHPTLPGIMVSSNGCDFTTEKNADILAVYKGKVSSVFSIPGAGQTIIISHGTYRTVYSQLASVTVREGDEVSVKQKIGTALFDGEDYTLHFEVWRVTADGGTPLNPELWLKRKN